ncbi:(2Fe-2S) ferredoxin domain-containing protein [Methylobacterium sp. J-068]|uniref:(2Fe-2S) ferredoxin domain-containing protein n=1 Tax=Methylobacterium sp. J-068 TaxID=2836649 RepID=UPI001FB8D528|nr:(2Fe-2S) ferredoxin domain-containing protein [Methylobacterium sp. J-068]MCJ2037236.1 (2Fe-2S) ferredoxin domain-containing protein [Methylobacterium sp. J-068]
MDSRTGESKDGVRPGATRVRLARSKFSELVLVCAKCAKRQGLKKGALRGRLKRELKGRALAGKPRVVEVGCLGPCPKHALAVATTESLAKQRIHLIDPESTPAQTVDALFPDFGPK